MSVIDVHSLASVRVTRYFAPLLVLIAVALSFAPALEGALLAWDDQELLIETQRWRGFSKGNLAWMFANGHMGHFEPLTWLSFALDYAWVGFSAPHFPEARHFHLVSIAWHALTALLVLGLARTLLERVLGPGPRSQLAALGAALFFAVHPLRVESVAWITERRDVVSGAFFVAALWTYATWARGRVTVSARALALVAALSLAAAILFFFSLRFDPSGMLQLAGPGLAGLVGALTLCVAAALHAGGRRAALIFLLLFASLLAKAWGMVLPALFLIVDLGWAGRLAPERPRWKSLGFLVLEKAPFAALALAFAVLAAWAQKSTQAATVGLDQHTLVERVAQAGYGLAFYPWKTLLPTTLLPLYSLPPTISFADPRFLWGGIASLTITLVCLSVARRWPLTASAWFAYAVCVSPVLGLLQSGPQLVADRYSYLSCLPLALLLAGALARLAGQRAVQAGALGLLASLWIVALGTLTQRQSKFWRDDESLWTWADRHDPGSPNVRMNLGMAWLRQSQGESDPERRRELLLQAGERFKTSAQLQDDPRVLTNLVQVELALSTLTSDESERRERREHAVQCGERAVRIARSLGFRTADHLMNWGAALVEVGRPAEAAQAFEEASRETPDNAVVWLNLGVARQRLLDWPRAREALERATSIAPDFVLAWWMLAVTLGQLGLPVETGAALQRVLALQPSHVQARAMLDELARRKP